MTTLSDPVMVRFEGIASGTEIWGGTQADFTIQADGSTAKEAAVLLNDPGAAILAEALGRENTEAFRHEAAEAAGRVIFESQAAQGGSIDSLVMVSKAYFESNPDVLNRVKALLA